MRNVIGWLLFSVTLFGGPAVYIAGLVIDGEIGFVLAAASIPISFGALLALGLLHHAGFVKRTEQGQPEQSK